MRYFCRLLRLDFLSFGGVLGRLPITVETSIWALLFTFQEFCFHSAAKAPSSLIPRLICFIFRQPKDGQVFFADAANGLCLQQSPFRTAFNHDVWKIRFDFIQHFVNLVELLHIRRELSSIWQM